jgi:hypothetical protein
LRARKPMVQEIQDKKYEIKTIKEVKYLPNVFMLRHTNGQLSIIAVSYSDFINCRNIENKLYGCFELSSNELRKTKEIYYVPGIPIFYISSQKSLIDSKKNARNIVTATLVNYGLIDRNLLITYTANEINAYDRFTKVQVYEFPIIYVQGNLEFYVVPEIDHRIEYDFEDTKELEIYNYKIQFSNDVMWSELYSQPGKAYLIYTRDNTDVVIKTTDNESISITLNGNKYYIITHPELNEEEIEEEGVETNGNS